MRLGEFLTNLFLVFKQYYTFFLNTFSHTCILKSYKQHYSNSLIKQILKMSWLSFLFFGGFKHNIISYYHIVLLKSACLGNWTWVIEFRLVSNRIKYNFKWIKNRFEGRNILGHKIIVHLRYIIFRIFGWLTFFDFFFFLLGNCLLRGIEPLR